MAIRKPSLSVAEARLLAETRAAVMRKPQVDNPATTPSPQSMHENNLEVASKQKGLEGQHIEKSSLIKGRSRSDEANSDKSTSLTQITSLHSMQAQGHRAEKVQVYLSALLPAPGISPVFEMLCRQYTPKKALQMVLRRAFQEYEAMLQDGTFKQAHETYIIDHAAGADEFIQTSRMVPKKLVGIARAHFDPLGLESTRSFGRKLASASLANFFASETNQFPIKNRKK